MNSSHEDSMDRQPTQPRPVRPLPDPEVSQGSLPTGPGAGRSVLGIIDRYELIEELGGGGFGVVYKARDIEAGIEVAVKGLPPLVQHNREELDRVRENFALVSRLHHPHIAAPLVLHRAQRVWYASEDVKKKLRVLEDDYLFVMSYAPGVTLSKWRKQFPGGKVPVDQALEICRQIAEALDYAHSQKVMHRDIKPSNIVVETLPSTPDPRPSNLLARVLDFGLAAEIRSSMSRISNEAGDTSGTRPYMAPEQWAGKKQGPATDQYALAVLFYELVSGEVPFAPAFETGDGVIMGRAVESLAPTPLAELRKRANQGLLRALSKNPSTRFPGCSEFVKSLQSNPRSVSEWAASPNRVAVTGIVIAGVIAGIWLSANARKDKLAAGPLPEQTAVERPIEIEGNALMRDQGDPEMSPSMHLLEAEHVEDETIERGRMAAGPSLSASDQAEKARESLRAQAESHRAAALAAREEAVEQKAEEWASHLWRLADDELRLADQAYADDRFAEAATLWASAVHGYMAAQELAQRTELKEKAEQARRSAEAVRQRAEAAGAEQFAARSWRLAEASMTAAADHAGEGRYSDAKREWDAARDAYEAGRTSAMNYQREQRRQQELARVRESAERARENAIAARRAAEEADAVDDAAALWRQAIAQMESASAATDDHRYAEAESDWLAAEKLFFEARHEAEGIRQHREEQLAARPAALTSQQTAASSRRAAERVNAEHEASTAWRRATAAQRRAETFMADQQFRDARHAWEQAATHFNEAAQIARHAQENREAIGRRPPPVLPPSF